MGSKLRGWVERIVAPSSQIKNELDRIEARALALQSFVILVALVILTFAFVIGFGHSLKSLEMAVYSSSVASALVCGVFFLARTRHFRWAATLFWGSSFLLVAASTIFQPQQIAAVSTMGYFVTIMVTASLFFPQRANNYFLFCYLGAHFLFIWMRPEIPLADHLSQAAQTFINWMVISAAALIRRQTSEIVGRQQLIVTQYAKLAAMGEMAAGVAHEINNPLAIIKLNAERLVAVSSDPAAKFDDEVRQNIAQVQKTADRIANIVQGLLSLSRDSGKTTAGAVSVAQVLRQVTSFGERFVRKSVTLKIVLPPESVVVWGNVTQIEQILLNLLNNAFDAVIAEQTPAIGGRWIEVVVHAHPDQVRILVSDSGALIPPAVRTKLFQPFYTTKAPGKGTGLGLSISRTLAENHGGSLQLVEDAPYTTFELVLRTRG